MAFISGNLLFSLRYRLEGVGGEEEVVAQVRVRQYYGANGPEYYPLLDWQEVEGSGQQELQIPIDRERVASGGRTYVEWRFARRGGGEKFDERKCSLARKQPASPWESFVRAPWNRVISN